jgi:hypothetical protein
MRRPSQMMRLLLTSFFGVIVGFLMGITFPTLTLTKVRLNLCFVQHVYTFSFIFKLDYVIAYTVMVSIFFVLKWLDESSIHIVSLD